MAVMEWRGHKLRLDPDTLSDLTMGQAKVIKRATGLRLVAFQTAVQEMVDSKDVDPELMQVFLWLLLAQNGVKQDISELDDVPLSEFMEALGSVAGDERPVTDAVDPTTAAAPVLVAPPNGSSNGSSTPTSNGDETNTFSNSPTTAVSAP